MRTELVIRVVDVNNVTVEEVRIDTTERPELRNDNSAATLRITAELCRHEYLADVSLPPWADR